ncbi:uncharacterized protein LOC111743414 isoform X2 [Pteropus vampyrus]|uniref:Uncharacterized protein LOC111743414 isoform X2 n=1 Tax=Pteropus vampyrus TaxID=132908 RepID=A0A6P6CPZ7_PTEVA|nr:uncharacterized protein LOC111743414 isoform X2 [Pteropus vampyrus]
MRTGLRAAARASRGGERGLHSSGGASYTLGYSRVLPKSAPPAYPGGGAKKSIITSPATLTFGCSEIGEWSQRDVHWVENFYMNKCPPCSWKSRNGRAESFSTSRRKATMTKGSFLHSTTSGRWEDVIASALLPPPVGGGDLRRCEEGG